MVVFLYFVFDKEIHKRERHARGFVAQYARLCLSLFPQHKALRIKFIALIH
jgi:hypothetical protein